MCIKKLRQAKRLPGDGSFNLQKVLSWLHPFQCSARHWSHPAFLLLRYPEPPRGPLAWRMLQHRPGATQCFRAGSLEQLQLISFWSHTKLNLEQVLRDQWCFPCIKPLHRKADYPRPDVAFCSHCRPSNGVRMTVCTFHWAPALTLASVWGSLLSFRVCLPCFSGAQFCHS